jgi:hypothetical protein
MFASSESVSVDRIEVVPKVNGEELTPRKRRTITNDNTLAT